VEQGAATFACCGAGDYGRCRAPKAEQQASDMEAPPEREGVECRGQREA